MKKLARLAAVTVLVAGTLAVVASRAAHTESAKIPAVQSSVAPFCPPWCLTNK